MNRMPLLPKLEGSSLSTTCMQCETLWTIQISWNLYHSHKQTKKSKSVTQKMEHDIATASGLKFFSTSEKKRCSPEAQHLKLFLVRQHMFANCGSEIHLTDRHIMLRELWFSIHIPSAKTGSKAFLRCFAFPRLSSTPSLDPQQSEQHTPTLLFEQFFH